MVFSFGVAEDIPRHARKAGAGPQAGQENESIASDPQIGELREQRFTAKIDALFGGSVAARAATLITRVPVATRFPLPLRDRLRTKARHGSTRTVESPNREIQYSHHCRREFTIAVDTHTTNHARSRCHISASTGTSRTARTTPHHPVVRRHLETPPANANALNSIHADSQRHRGPDITAPGNAFQQLADFVLLPTTDESIDS